MAIIWNLRKSISQYFQKNHLLKSSFVKVRMRRSRKASASKAKRKKNMKSRNYLFPLPTKQTLKRDTLSILGSMRFQSMS